MQDAELKICPTSLWSEGDQVQIVFIDKHSVKLCIVLKSTVH